MQLNRTVLGLAAVTVVTIAWPNVASAQIVTITATNYMAGPPPSAKPQGTYSVPVKHVNSDWRIVVDYGTIAGGQFSLWQGGATITVTPTGGGLFNWAQLPPPTQLMNPPQGLHVRVRLQRDHGWFWGWETEATAYASCP